MLRAGVVAVLAAGALFGVPSPAHAATPELSVSPGNVTINAGSDATVTVKITTKDPGDISVSLSLAGLPAGVTCTSGTTNCDDLVVTVVPDTEKTVLLKVKAAANAPAANGVSITVGAQAASGANTDNFNLTVNAQQQPENVKDVTVRIFDIGTGQPIAGAQVIIEDSAGRSWNAQATSTGQVRITSTASRPIAPGEIRAAAGQDGYQNAVKAAEGRVGQSVVIEIRLTSTATPSATPALPTELPSDTAAPTATQEQAINPNLSGNDEGGGLSWMLIVMGGLLVALGVGAIVLLLLRRRDDGEDGEIVETPTYAPRGPAPLPAGRNVYRAGGPQPAIAGRPADRTMVTRQPMDAPTMMHGRPDYGGGMPAPRPPQPGYGPPQTPGYGAPAPYPTSPSPAYGGTPGYPSAPASPPGYGPPPAAPRSAEPYRGADYGDRGYAGGYGTAEPRQYDDGYGQSTANYGAQAPGYGPTSYDQGYGEATAPYGQQAGGYAPSGYGQQGYGQQGYDQGYDAQGGYGGGGGYERVPEQRNGYDAQGYDAGGGYYEEPAGRRTNPRSERRSLDWLDD